MEDIGSLIGAIALWIGISCGLWWLHRRRLHGRQDRQLDQAKRAISLTAQAPAVFDAIRGGGADAGFADIKPVTHALLKRIQEHGDFFDRANDLRVQLQAALGIDDHAALSEILHLRRDLWAASEILLVEDPQALGPSFAEPGAYDRIRGEAEHLLFKQAQAAGDKDLIDLRLALAQEEAAGFSDALGEAIRDAREKDRLPTWGEVVAYPLAFFRAIPRLIRTAYAFAVAFFTYSADAARTIRESEAVARGASRLQQARQDWPERLSAGFERASHAARGSGASLRRHYDFLVTAYDFQTKYEDVLRRAPEVTERGRQFIARLELAEKSERLRLTSANATIWLARRLLDGSAHALAGLQTMAAWLSETPMGVMAATLLAPVPARGRETPAFRSYAMALAASGLSETPRQPARSPEAAGKGKIAAKGKAAARSKAAAKGKAAEPRKQPAAAKAAVPAPVKPAATKAVPVAKVKVAPSVKPTPAPSRSASPAPREKTASAPADAAAKSPAKAAAPSAAGAGKTAVAPPPAAQEKAPAKAVAARGKAVAPATMPAKAPTLPPATPATAVQTRVKPESVAAKTEASGKPPRRPFFSIYATKGAPRAAPEAPPAAAKPEPATSAKPSAPKPLAEAATLRPIPTSAENAVALPRATTRNGGGSGQPGDAAFVPPAVPKVPTPLSPPAAGTRKPPASAARLGDVSPDMPQPKAGHVVSDETGETDPLPGVEPVAPKPRPPFVLAEDEEPAPPPKRPSFLARLFSPSKARAERDAQAEAERLAEALAEAISAGELGAPLPEPGGTPTLMAKLSSLDDATGIPDDAASADLPEEEPESAESGADTAAPAEPDATEPQDEPGPLTLSIMELQAKIGAKPPQIRSFPWLRG